MKNQKYITKILFLTCLIVGGSVNANNFQTCIPTEEYLKTIAKQARSDEEIINIMKKYTDRQICLYNKRKCEEINDCFNRCYNEYCYIICNMFPEKKSDIKNICINRCGFPSSCGTCP